VKFNADEFSYSSIVGSNSVQAVGRLLTQNNNLMEEIS